MALHRALTKTVSSTDSTKAVPCFPRTAHSVPLLHRNVSGQLCSLKRHHQPFRLRHSAGNWAECTELWGTFCLDWPKKSGMCVNVQTTGSPNAEIEEMLNWAQPKLTWGLARFFFWWISNCAPTPGHWTKNQGTCPNFRRLGGLDTDSFQRQKGRGAGTKDRSAVGTD